MGTSESHGQATERWLLVAVIIVVEQHRRAMYENAFLSPLGEYNLIHRRRECIIQILTRIEVTVDGTPFIMQIPCAAV